MSKPIRKPIDHLPKVARRMHLSVVLDDEKADEYEFARDALAAKRAELVGTASNRAAGVRALMPAVPTDEQLAQAFGNLTKQDEDALAEPIARLEAAEKALEKATVRFTLRAIPRAEWKALKKQHPPESDEDSADWEANGGGDAKPEYSLDGIARDLLAASIVEPPLTRVAIDEMFDSGEWSDPELDNLRNHALLAQGTYRADPKGPPPRSQ